MTLCLMILANLLVGLCIGLTGIGFLLPLFYIAFLNMDTTEAMAFSFSAFLVSGILGTIGYQKNGNMNYKVGSLISIGSFAGAILGVFINLKIPSDTFKIVLYIMVFISCCSILSGSGSKKSILKQSFENTNISRKYSFYQTAGYILLGFVTSVICAAAGAGGPILVMPVLSIIGYPAHLSIGIALFNSIFIALPAAPGYLIAASHKGANLKILPILLIIYGIGVLIGSKYTVKINQNILKKIIAITSIAIAIIKLVPYFI